MFRKVTYEPLKPKLDLSSYFSNDILALYGDGRRAPTLLPWGLVLSAGPGGWGMGLGTVYISLSLYIYIYDIS